MEINMKAFLDYEVFEDRKLRDIVIDYAIVISVITVVAILAWVF